MNDPRLGAVIRALRRRRGWRQRDLATAAGVSQQLISNIERGLNGDVSTDRLRRIAVELEASLFVELRWRAGALDRLIDERHAAVVGSAMTLLVDRGWAAEPEVTYSHFGERGAIDILAWQEKAHAILVVEIKSELVSVEATLRKLDEKVRLARVVTGERIGWRPIVVGRMLVLPSTSTQRRQVARHAAVLDAALPLRFNGMRAWLERPVGRADGILFVADTTGRGGKSVDTTAHRIRPHSDAA